MKSYKCYGPFGPFMFEGAPEYKYKWQDKWGRRFGILFYKEHGVGVDSYEIFFGMITNFHDYEQENFDVEVHNLPKNSNPFLTMNTVIKCIQDFLVTYKPKSIYFATDELEDKSANLRNKVFNYYFNKYKHVNKNYELVRGEFTTIFRRKW